MHRVCCQPKDTAIDAVDQAVTLKESEQRSSLYPEVAVDIIISAMDSVGQADVTDEEISSAIDTKRQANGFYVVRF